MCVLDWGSDLRRNLSDFRTGTELDLQVDAQSIYDYLFFHVIPSPRTVYKGVFSLTPGSFMEVSEGEVRTGVFWKPSFVDETARGDFSALKDEFRSALRRSVENEVASTEAPGCFLERRNG